MANATSPPNAAPTQIARPRPVPHLTDAERRELRQAVDVCGGVAGAARALNLPRSAVVAALGGAPQRAGTVALMRDALVRIGPTLDGDRLSGA